MHKMKSFSARIFKIDINPVVDVPEDVLNELLRRAGKTKGPIPVKGKLNGKPFIQTVVKYRGAWRLYLNTPMRKAAGVDDGDMANVELDFDSKPRTILMHPELAKALAENKRAKAVFEKLIPSRKKEIVRYLNSMKTDESVKRNIKKILQHLAGKQSFAGKNL